MIVYVKADNFVDYNNAVVWKGVDRPKPFNLWVSFIGEAKSQQVPELYSVNVLNLYI